MTDLHAGRSVAEAALIHQAAALVLSYPEEPLLAALDTIEAALAGTDAAAQFADVLGHLRGSDLIALQSFHVQEFDLSRRHALHLSYWTEGDTRRRGEVLGRFKRVYRDSGLLVDTHGELPDHLTMVLEFAVHDPERGAELLQQWRPSLELLRLGLEEDDLPHAGVLRAVCATLPGPSPASRAEVQQFVQTIQPAESVGLEPYGAEPPIAFLGMPGVRTPAMQRS